jgi:Na+-exporting ATPase
MITVEFKKSAHDMMLRFSAGGMRVLAIAYKTLPLKHENYASLRDVYCVEKRDEIEQGFTFLGLLAIYDPPRATSAEAVQMCHQAGNSIVLLGEILSVLTSIPRN